MYEKIAEFVNEGKQQEALQLINEELALGTEYNDTLAILEAEVYRQQGNREKLFESIQKGLLVNPYNFELYFLLGEYYQGVNDKQAYLCYEQAEYYCECGDDLLAISAEKEKLKVKVPGVSFVILSYNAKEEMKLCLESIKKNVPSSYEIIIIDNASTDGVKEYLKEQNGFKIAFNDINVGFPAGCNQGIKMAIPENDIFLLNNDTIVPPNAIFWLRMGLYEDEIVGATGSVSNCVSNFQAIDKDYSTVEEWLKFAQKNNVLMDQPYERKIRLIGFALMLKRTVLDQVGWLDERYTPGNFEDDDLSFRLLQAGYQMLLCRNAFIFHWGSRSFSKNIEQLRQVVENNQYKFRQKWGMDAYYYSYERRELTEFIDAPAGQSMNVLEIGCGLGATLGHIQNFYPNASVYGIELDPHVVNMAQKYIPTIIQGDIESMQLDYPDRSFDYIIFADVIEHLHTPEAVLKRVERYLKPDGFILVSIPNVMNYTVILDLLKGWFTYADSGILDRTHLRFFTLKESVGMFKRCGYKVTDFIRKCIELPTDDQEMYDALLKIPNIAAKEEFDTYQYLFKIQKAKNE